MIRADGWGLSRLQLPAASTCKGTRMKRLACCLAVISLAFLAYVALPVRSDTKDAKPTKIDKFTLKDSAGKAWSLSDVKESKAVGVLFLGTECPINNKHMPLVLVLHNVSS